MLQLRGKLGLLGSEGHFLLVQFFGLRRFQCVRTLLLLGLEGTHRGGVFHLQPVEFGGKSLFRVSGRIGLQPLDNRSLLLAAADMRQRRSRVTIDPSETYFAAESPDAQQLF